MKDYMKPPILTSGNNLDVSYSILKSILDQGIKSTKYFIAFL